MPWMAYVPAYPTVHPSLRLVDFRIAHGMHVYFGCFRRYTRFTAAQQADAGVDVVRRSLQELSKMLLIVVIIAGLISCIIAFSVLHEEAIPTSKICRKTRG